MKNEEVGFRVQKQKNEFKERLSKRRSEQEINKGTTKTINRCPLLRLQEGKGSQGFTEASVERFVCRINRAWWSICL